jgi:hypothetical protein
MPVNDYTFDPFQVGESDIAERIKQALAMQLRQIPNASQDPGGFAMGAMSRVSAGKDLDRAQDDRKKMSDLYEQSLTDALRGQPQEIQDLVRSPATRAQGLDLMKKRQQMALDQEEIDNIRGRGRGQGSALPGAASANEYQIALEMAQSSNPTVAARGKVILEQMKPFDPTHFAGRNPDGSIGVIPGGGEAANMAQRLKGINTPMPDGQGGSVLPWTDPRATQGLPGLPGQAPTSGGSPATPPQGMPGGNVPPPMGGPVPGAGAPNSGLIPPGAGGGPTGAGANQMQVPPEVQLQRDVQALQLLRQERQSAPDQRTAMALDQEIQMRTQKISQLYAQVQQKQQGGQPQAPQMPQQPPSALPGATAASTRQMPQAPFGSSPPKVSTELFGKTREGDLAALTELEKGTESVPLMLYNVQQLRDMNKNPTYAGAGVPLAQGANYLTSAFGGGDNPKLANTMALESLVKNMAGPLAKQLGYNPSNVDLNTALAQLPQAAFHPTTRNAILDRMEQGLQYQMATTPVIRQLVEQGMSVRQAQQQADQMYKEHMKQQQQYGRPPGNPTDAGGSSALPSAKAAQASTPGFTDALGDSEFWTRDVPNAVKSLPGAIFSQQGMEAAKDASMNPVRGVGQWIGAYGRDDWKQEKARQDAAAAADPKYAQSKDFFNVANPSALVGGAAATLPKLAIAGALQAGMQPTENADEQLMNAGKGGALAGVLGLLAKAIPSTRLAGDINKGGAGDDLLKQFPSFRPTSAQMNSSTLGSRLARDWLGVNEARSLEQTQAITKDLLAKAGIPGTQVTEKALTAGRSALSQGYEDLTKNVVVKVDSRYKPAWDKLLQDAPQAQEIIGKSPALATLDTLINGNPGRIPAKSLTEAWKQIGQVAGADPYAAGQLRVVLAQMIEANLGKQSVAKFRELNQKWGATEDIARVYGHGTGEGAGAAAGSLSPAKLVEEAKASPNANSATADAAKLINRFEVRNPSTGVGSTPTGLFQAAREGIGATTGPVINAFDKSALNLNPSTKYILELLRGGLPRAGIAMQNEIGAQ